MKKYVYENDDINYPFYIIQPNAHPGSFEFRIRIKEFNNRIKPCSDGKTEDLKHWYKTLMLVIIVNQLHFTIKINIFFLI